MFGKEKIVKTVGIEGMSCMHCAASVETALKSLKEVSSVTVDLDKKCAIVKLKKDIEPQLIIKSVENAGFKVTEIK